MNGLCPHRPDPGTDSARVVLIFDERAAWLYLTGERQGDLRRLLRQYTTWFRRPNQVYPTGVYPAAVGQYGNDVNAPLPETESINPLFTGCHDRGP